MVTRFSGQRLRKAREDAGMSGQVAATKLGVALSALYAWERGERKPNDADFIGRAANLYGVTVQWFYTR